MPDPGRIRDGSQLIRDGRRRLHIPDGLGRPKCLRQ
jgi:hypothetical protein